MFYLSKKRSWHQLVFTKRTCHTMLSIIQNCIRKNFRLWVFDAILYIIFSEIREWNHLSTLKSIFKSFIRIFWRCFRMKSWSTPSICFVSPAQWNPSFKNSFVCTWSMCKHFVKTNGLNTIETFTNSVKQSSLYQYKCEYINRCCHNPIFDNKGNTYVY